MLVDSPGMIDAHGHRGGSGGGGSDSSDSSGEGAAMRGNRAHALSLEGVCHGSGADSGMGREYDFPGVAAWLAARADVILFLFDPDKPGTTGETLAVLRHIRRHHAKVHLVLNKVDDFESIADLARCFGTLTWNLARVLQGNKDMPRIVPMFVPMVDASDNPPVVIGQSPLVCLH